MRSRSLAPAAVVFAVLTSACEGESLSVLTPSGAFEPASIDFGAVPIGSQGRFPVRLVNQGPVMLTFEGVVVSLPEFGIELADTAKGGSLPGQRVAPGTSLDLLATFTPTQLGRRQTVLTVNTRRLGMEISLSGEGSDAGSPVLVAEPNPLDFGRIDVGGQTTAILTLSNGGAAPAILHDQVFSSSGSGRSGGDIFSLNAILPITVPDGGSTQVTLGFSATQEGTFTDKLTFNPDTALPFEIDLFGTASSPAGDFSCQPAPVNFGPVQRGASSTVRVRCTVVGGSADLRSGRIEAGSNSFVLVTPPVPNRFTEGQFIDMDLRFAAEGLPRVVQGHLRLEYDNGSGPAVTRVELRGEVVPPDIQDTAIRVRLDWDTNNTDLDLHLVAPGGRTFHNTLDCYFSNRTPDWGVPSDARDNPFLDDDDTNGFGPETINLGRSGPAQYQVYIHYWADNGRGASTGQVEVFLGGQSVFTGSQRMRCTEEWHVGTVTWDGRTGTFTPVGRVAPGNRGGC